MWTILISTALKGILEIFWKKILLRRIFVKILFWTRAAYCLEHEKDKYNNPHFGHKAPPKKPECSCPRLCVTICARHKLQILDSKSCTLQIRWLPSAIWWRGCIWRGNCRPGDISLSLSLDARCDPGTAAAHSWQKMASEARRRRCRDTHLVSTTLLPTIGHNLFWTIMLVL